MLPISVIIPTRNSARQLPRHLAALRGWLAEVQEVVVVDSESSDGTLELLRNGLQHPRCRVLSHPPGLYQSWNFGIRHLAAPYAYISTVGDTITLAGLKHLLDTAVAFEAEVVLSPPTFYEKGRRLERKQWTIHQHLGLLRILEPIPLPRSHLFLASAFAGPSGLMGSSASNLYATRTLQDAPFPTDFGHVGDTAWGLINAFRVRAALTPEPCATFEIHPNAGQIPEQAEFELADRLLEVARRTLSEAIAAAAVPPQAANLRGILDEFASLRQVARAAHSQYQALRRSRFPWFLQPRAWIVRRRRNLFRRAIRDLLVSSLRNFDF